MKLNKNDLKAKFEVSFLEEARDFLDGLGEKERKKIIYNIDKAKVMNDPELFKKLTDIVWEFRTLYRNTKYRLLAFWDKENNKWKAQIRTNGKVKNLGRFTDILEAVHIRNKAAKKYHKQFANLNKNPVTGK